MNFERIVVTTFPGYFFTQILCLRSILLYAAGKPVDIIVDDFGLAQWPTYVDDCKRYIKDNFPTLDITFHYFSGFSGMEKIATGGWFRQQLVKLYLDKFVTGNSWLLVDSDVVFLEPPGIDLISAVPHPNPGSIDIGNRLYVKTLLDCEQPWVGDEQDYWCLSSIPFRWIARDLLEQLRTHVEQQHNKNLFDLHLSLFEQQQLVAYDPESQKMVMSEFQLIEVFRHRYYHTPLPVFKNVASKFEHSSIKDWNTDRSVFENLGLVVDNSDWNNLQQFGARHV